MNSLEMIHEKASSDETRSPLGREISRQGFLNFLLGASFIAATGSTFYTLIKYLWPSKEILGLQAATGKTIIPLLDLPPGKGKIVRYQGKPVIVLRLIDGTRALSAICTHLGCIVYWDEAKKVIACPCHAGFFDVNGNVISGPPPKPLKSYNVAIVDDKLIIG
jgi:Rieske Fe-S protein